MRGRVAAPWEDCFIPEPNTGCFLWLGKRTKKGYGLLNRKMKMILAHRYAWEMVNGSIPAGMMCLHHCDQPACVRVDHLFIGTGRENLEDAIVKGRWAPARRLRACEVEEIRRLGGLKVRQETIAQMFRTTQSHVSNILAGRKRLKAWPDA
jgi:hypothetical protein